MFSLVTALAFAVIGVQAYPQTAYGGMKTCSWTNKPPCSCPSGTYFNESTTTATIGANAHDVAAVMGSCEFAS